MRTTLDLDPELLARAEAAAPRRMTKTALVEAALDADTRRRVLLKETEALKNQLNVVSKEIGKLRKNGVDTAAQQAAIVGAIVGTMVVGCSGVRTTAGCGTVMTADGRTTATPMLFSARSQRNSPAARSRSSIRPRAEQP